MTFRSGDSLMPVYGESKKANPNLVDHRTARKSYEVRYSIIIESQSLILSGQEQKKSQFSHNMDSRSSRLGLLYYQAGTQMTVVTIR